MKNRHCIFLLLFVLISSHALIDHCINAYASYPPNHPSKPQITPQLYRLMKDFHEILTANDVSYWIIHGTLLGAEGNEEILPWDDDLDIGIAEKNLERFINLKEEFKKRGYEFSSYSQLFEGKPLFFKIAAQNGKPFNGGGWFFKYPWIDIMVFAENEDNFIHHPKGPFAVWKNAYFTKNELFPLKLYKLGSIFVFGPNDCIPFLNRFYPNWQTTYVYWSHRSDKLKLQFKNLLPLIT